MVAIRYGSQTIDPVTGLVATVVGIRLDVFKKMPVPVTAACWLMMAEQTNSVQVWRRIIFFWQTFTLSYLFLLALLHFLYTFSQVKDKKYLLECHSCALCFYFSSRLKGCRGRHVQETLTGSSKGIGRKKSLLSWTQLCSFASVELQM